MTSFDSQLVQLRKDIKIGQSLDFVKEDFSELSETTSNLMLEAYSLAFGKEHKTEYRLYEIYHTLIRRYPRFVVEVRHPSFFRSKLKCIKYNKFLWNLLDK